LGAKKERLSSEELGQVVPTGEKSRKCSLRRKTPKSLLYCSGKLTEVRENLPFFGLPEIRIDAAVE
jgi:hypothetical protein